MTNESRHKERGVGDLRELSTIERKPIDELPEALDQLERVASEWLAGYANEFDLHQWDDISEHKFRRKAFAEAATAALQATRSGGKPDALEAIHDVVVEQTNTRAYHHSLNRHDTRVRAYAFPVIYTKLEGKLENELLWEDLRSIVAADAVWGSELRPFEMLDLWATANLCDVEPRYTLDCILPVSCLSPPVDPIRADLSDVYSFTHNVMFYHGLGVADGGFPDQPTPFDLGVVHRALILRFVADGSYDILLELLMSGSLEHDLPPDLVGFVLQAVLDATTERGYVPDYTGENSESSNIRDNASDIFTDPDSLHWGSNYHQNIVAVMASRIARENWSALTRAFPEVDRPRYDYRDLATLADAINALGNYDLKAAARKLTATAESDVVDAFPGVFDTAVSFLEGQRRRDGEFGYWAEEKHKFTSLGYDGALFGQQLVEPSTAACRDALLSVEDAREQL